MKKVTKLLVTMATVALSMPFAFAEETATAAATYSSSDLWPMAIKAAAYFLAVAIAAFGGTAAQSKAASVALEGIARNPSAAKNLFVPMLLGLALIETLVIFTLISVKLA